jgi:hypothetical protein
MQPDDDARREARRDWHVSRHRLTDVAAANGTTAEQRLAMMWELVVQAWAIAGKPIPAYERAQMPVRLCRLQDGDRP